MTSAQALVQLRVWIEHWQADKALGLMPTDGSFAAALACIDAAKADEARFAAKRKSQ